MKQQFTRTRLILWRLVNAIFAWHFCSFEGFWGSKRSDSSRHILALIISITLQLFWCVSGFTCRYTCMTDAGYPCLKIPAINVTGNVSVFAVFIQCCFLSQLSSAPSPATWTHRSAFVPNNKPWSALWESKHLFYSYVLTVHILIHSRQILVVLYGDSVNQTSFSNIAI